MTNKIVEKNYLASSGWNFEFSKLEKSCNPDCSSTSHELIWQAACNLFESQTAKRKPFGATLFYLELQIRRLCRGLDSGYINRNRNYKYYLIKAVTLAKRIICNYCIRITFPFWNLFDIWVPYRGHLTWMKIVHKAFLFVFKLKINITPMIYVVHKFLKTIK